jgi:hypothetical protein
VGTTRRRSRRVAAGGPEWLDGLAHYVVTHDLDAAVRLAEQRGEDPWSAGIDEKMIGPFWTHFEAELMTMWLRDHHQAGRRPPAWWWHSTQATEARAIASGEWQLMPSRWRWRKCGRPWGMPVPGSAVTFESQPHYLRRHGLFLRGEERRVPAGEFEPKGWREEPLV